MSFKKNIYVFTSSFPCDEHGEIYLWDELAYLANEFNAVYFLPQKGTVSIRSLPTNCFVIPAPIIEKHKVTIPIVFQTITWVLSDFSVLFKKKLLCKLLIYNYSLLKQLVLKSDYYSTIISESSTATIYLYSYWLSDYATTVALVKKKLPNAIAISRAHGFDVFENQTEYDYIPFRKLQFKYIDDVFSVSKAGAHHLKNSLPFYKEKIKCSYLGSVNSNSNKEFITDKFQIASCSIIRDIKRLHLMIDVLKHVEFPLIWHVIGDGPDFESFKKRMQEMPSHIKIVFYGLLSKEEINNFYLTHEINLFVSVSSSEGLPVSMMEAQSYGIPIMSTDVGGCNEICNDETGFLIEKDFDSKDVALKILEFSKSSKNTNIFHQQCRSYWEKYFNAQVNYKFFAKAISNLKLN
jgi:glycosyltransferase involved in cell wall biosynthesis